MFDLIPANLLLNQVFRVNLFLFFLDFFIIVSFFLDIWSSLISLFLQLLLVLSRSFHEFFELDIENLNRSKSFMSSQDCMQNISVAQLNSSNDGLEYIH